MYINLQVKINCMFNKFIILKQGLKKLYLVVNSIITLDVNFRNFRWKKQKTEVYLYLIKYI